MHLHGSDPTKTNSQVQIVLSPVARTSPLLSLSLSRWRASSLLFLGALLQRHAVGRALALSSMAAKTTMGAKQMDAEGAPTHDDIGHLTCSRDKRDE